MKSFLALIFLLFSTQSLATIKVAVIDTGFDFNSNWDQKSLDTFGLKKPKLCDSSLHRDFTGEGIQDNHGHGTHVAGLIAREAGDSDYCLVIIKGLSHKPIYPSKVNVSSASFMYAIQIGANIINYSGGGKEFDFQEYSSVKMALDSGITIVAAAGNESSEVNHVVSSVSLKYDSSYFDSVTYKMTVLHLNLKTKKIEPYVGVTYYPANYDHRIVSVKNMTVRNSKKVIHESSNRGLAFTTSEIGANVLSLGLNGEFKRMTGTSQAAPVKTGKIVKEWNQKRR